MSIADYHVNIDAAGLGTDSLLVRFLRFWLGCVGSAAMRSVAPANAWGSIGGAIGLWLMLYAMGWELIIPDRLPGMVVVTLACLVSAWLVIFLLRAIFYQPAAQFLTAETELTNLRSKVTNPTPDIAIDTRGTPEILTRVDDADEVIHIIVRDFHLTNRSDFAASIEVRLKLYMGGMALIPNQDDNPLEFVERAKERDPSIGKHLRKRISLPSHEGVNGYLSYRIFDPLTRAFAAANSMETVDFLKTLDKTIEIQDHVSGVTKSLSFDTLGPYLFRDL